MPHALRSADGAILSLHREPVPGGELLSADHPDVLAFVSQGPGDEFANLDAGLIRVIEDLVDVLVARNIIRITDLPPQAQHKLFDRKGFRDQFRRHALQLFGEDDAPIATGGGSGSLPALGDTL